MKQLFALLAAMIWGLAFSAQSYCLSAGLGTHSINLIRAVLACGILLVLSFIFARPKEKLTAAYKKKALIGGFWCGLVLFVATTAQQYGLSQTSSGKSGFITALYMVLVPAFGIFTHKKTTLQTWISVVIAVIGMYFLCIDPSEAFTIQTGDLWLMLCAVLFTGHILVVDHFSKEIHGIHLSLMQFAAVVILAGACVVLFEQPKVEALQICWPQLLYLGLMSSGIAYTFQILAQQGANPTVVSILLSMESVFAVIGGALFLHEVMSLREYIGCAIMMSAVILSQLRMPSKNQKTAA